MTIRSQNFCPTLEACLILGLSTVVVCRRCTEKPMEAMLQQVSPRLRFRRRYDRIRPRTPYCEETIRLE